MNPEKQRIAIALFTLDISPLWRNILASPESPQKSRQVERFLFQVPDYPNDLNAMHEAEKFISEKYRFLYETILHSLNLKYGLGISVWETIHATAAQRAEAFLRTIDKWEE